MEFHGGGSEAIDGGTKVTVMACTDTTCRQFQIFVTTEEAKKYGDDQKIVEKALTVAFKKDGEKVLKFTSLEEILKANPDALEAK